MAESWSNEKAAELITMYEQEPCLYNTKNKDYHNRDLRSLKISEHFGNCTVRFYVLPINDNMYVFMYNVVYLYC